MGHPLLPQRVEMVGLLAVLPLLGMAGGQDFLPKEMQHLEKMEECVVCHHLWLLTSKANDRELAPQHN